MKDATCRDVHAHASAFVDGELDRDAWQTLSAHLGACPPCAEYVRQLGLTVELLRRIPGPCGQEVRAELVRRFQVWCDSRSGRGAGPLPAPPPGSRGEST
jgi:anti-sigma factor RsiW